MFIIVTRLSHTFLRIVTHYSIHRLQFGLVNVFIAPIGFSCFTTLNIIYLRRYVRGVVTLKCCSKWSENESDFCPFLSRRRISEKWPSILFFVSLLSVTCMNIVTNGAFYFEDYTFRPAFTFIDKISVEFWWKRTVTFSIH